MSIQTFVSLVKLDHMKEEIKFEMNELCAHIKDVRITWLILDLFYSSSPPLVRLGSTRLVVESLIVF